MIIIVKNEKKVEVIIKIFIGGLALILAACGTGEFEDLQQYVKQVKSRPGSPIAGLPEAKPYDRFLYEDMDLRDPFRPTVQATARSSSGLNKLRPNINRDSEVLENFSLDTLKMVGSLKQDNQKWGIVMTADGFIHRVKRGSHVGKNFGKITRITDSEIKITEIISDGMGGWLERQAALKISE